MQRLFVRSEDTTHSPIISQFWDIRSTRNAMARDERELARRVELLPLVHEWSRFVTQTLPSYAVLRILETRLPDPLTRGEDGRNFISIRLWRSRSPPPPCGPRPLEALTSRRSQSTRVGHTNSFRRRIHSAWTVPLVSFDPASSDQRDGARERALTRRELALRAVAAVGADRHLPELPTTEAPRAGSSSGEPVQPCRGRLARRGHHLAPRPALGCATGAATNRAGDR